MKRVMYCVCAAVLFLFASGGSLDAQVPTGSITGTVLDSSGLPVPAAEVKLTNEGTGRVQTAQTSDLGRFVFASLNSGFYKVTVTVAGFRTHVSSNIKLDAGTQYSVPPIRLELGEVTSTVVVEAGTQAVQTTDAQVTSTISRQLIDNLPLLNRDPFSLLTQQAGAGGPAGQNTVIHGMRTSFGNVTLDGINIQDNFIRSNALDFLPNRITNNTVAEFTIGSQNTGTEAGLGASQVNFVTPSGTNAWHGDVFWYHRNNALAARDYFDAEKQKLVQNQLGGSIGGPLIRDKLFIYGEYEAFRRRDSDTKNVTILTDTARNGIFRYVTTCNNTSTTCPAGVNPGDILQFNLNSLPGFSFDPAVQAIIAAMPTTINNFDVGDSSATQMLNTAGFRFNQIDAEDRDAFTIRADWNLTPKHSISGTFRYNQATNDRTDIDNTFNRSPVVFTTSSIPFLSVAWRWTPSARFTNEFRGGFSLNDPFFHSKRGDAPFVLNCGELVFACLEEDFRQQGRRTNTYTLQDNASYQMGNHSIRFGWLSNFIRVQSQTEFNVPPTVDLDDNSGNRFSFTSLLPGPIRSADRTFLNDLIADMGGYIDDVDEDFNVTSRTSGFVRNVAARNNMILNGVSVYGGDSWKVRKNVTFNYGLRWELIGRFDEANGLFLAPVIPPGRTARQTVEDPTTVLDFIGGDTGRKVYELDVNNFAPNFGLAWDVFGNGRTAIRAGYSIHYANDEAIRSADNAVSGNAGLFSTVSLDTFNAGLGQVQVSSGVPMVPAPTFIVPRTLTDTNAENGGLPQTIFTVDPNYRTPYVQQWNLTISQDVGWNSVLDVRYIGNKGTSLGRGVDFNQVDIRSNGFLEDFLRARSNGFLAEAATGVFDPRFNPNISGSQPLPVFAMLPGGGFISPSNFGGFFVDAIETGEPGQAAANYHFNGPFFSGTFPFTANPLAGVADVLMNLGHSSYHAGVVELRRRPSRGEGLRGLGFQANYTWSKVLTNSDGIGQTNFDPFLDILNQGLDRSRATFDLTHAFKANFIYELPMGKGHRFSSSNSFLNSVLSGWSISSLFVWQSGEPFSIVSNRGTLNRAARSTGKNTAVSLLSDEEINNNLGVFRPTSGPFAGQVLVINPNLIDPTTGRGVGPDAVTCNTTSFTGQAFCNPEPGQVGNLGRRAFNGPWFFNWDFAVLKDTHITEGVRAQFRAEFFNMPNHPTFNAADENINSTSFGVLSSTVNSPRLIQMALRIIF